MVAGVSPFAPTLWQVFLNCGMESTWGSQAWRQGLAESRQAAHMLQIQAVWSFATKTGCMSYTNVCSFVSAEATLQEEDAEVAAFWGKKGGAAQAMVEEEDTDYTDYSPPQRARKGRAPGPKKTKQMQEGGSSHPNRKKAGGPCVLCFATSKLSGTTQFSCV